MLNNFDDDLNVVVIGAVGGIGEGFVHHLLDDPKVKTLHAFSRQDNVLTHAKLTCHAMDITDEAAVEEGAKKASENAPIDIVVIAAGLLHNDQGLAPEKSLRDINKSSFDNIFAVNTIGPALVMKHFLPKLNRDRKTVFTALSARVGSISDNQLGGWYAYRASKSALNMLIKTASIEVARKYKQACVVGLHPGTVDTNLSEPFKSNVAEDKLFSSAYSSGEMLKVIDGLSAEQTGKVFAYDGSEIPA